MVEKQSTMEAMVNVSNHPSLPLLALAIPCYNEEEIISNSMRILNEHLTRWKQDKLIHEDSFFCYVDDGSNDRTWQLLAAETGKHCHAIKLAHNVGHQNALFAGMVYVADRSDCCISLDADLQDDLSVIPEMLARYREGCEVVYGVRTDRSSDSWIKRSFANSYYWLAAKIGIAGIPNHADFRLLSRRALLIIREFREQHLYWRGIVPSLNLPSAKVFYKRQARVAGSSKYTIIKSLALALNGLTSFSIVPLRFITLLGFVISLISFYFICSLIYNYYFDRTAVQGWTSLLVSLYFLGGLIMFSLGITGEYIGKIFIESKKRPLYIVEQQLDDTPPPPAA